MVPGRVSGDYMSTTVTASSYTLIKQPTYTDVLNFNGSLRLQWVLNF